MLIEREILPKIYHWLGKNKILLIKGSRQVGKTTMLKIMQSKLDHDGKKTFYASIDQELANPVFRSSTNFVRFLKDQFSDKKKLYVFLDEFQYLDQPGLFLKTFYDQTKDIFQLIVSGSSSLEITKNVEFLTGRKIEFELYGLNYREFLSYKSGLKLPKTISLHHFEKLKEFYKLYKSVLTDHFFEYISFGGYPEVVTTRSPNDKLTLLKEIITTYIEKDIIAFLGVENVTAFRNLLRILADQIGNLVNKSELSNTINLSMDTLRKYLDILDGTYVVDFLRPFFSNIRKELSKMPKVYMNDFGIRNVVLNELGMKMYASGAERENFVYNVLKTQYGKENIKFYRTISKAEIDFIIDAGNSYIPVEVKSAHKAVKKSQIMTIFNKTYNKKIQKNIIVTEDFLQKSPGIYFIPIALLPFVGL